MKRVLVASMTVFAFGVLLPRTGRCATTLHCSVHAGKRTAKQNLETKAKVSKEAAQNAALASFAASSPPEIVESELEVERGCLVYSFDLRVAGEKGITEVIVDAGTGKVLSRTHESAAQESAEKAKEGTGRDHK